MSHTPPDSASPQAGPPTIGVTRRMGICAFSVWCTRCRHSGRFTFAGLSLPDELVFIEIPRARRFRCSRCGARDVGVMPDWRDYRASGTGTL